jgi:hypothetical protein
MQTGTSSLRSALPSRLFPRRSCNSELAVPITVPHPSPPKASSAGERGTLTSPEPGKQIVLPRFELTIGTLRRLTELSPYNHLPSVGRDSISLTPDPRAECQLGGRGRCDPCWANNRRAVLAGIAGAGPFKRSREKLGGYAEEGERPPKPSTEAPFPPTRSLCWCQNI